MNRYTLAFLTAAAAPLLALHAHAASCATAWNAATAYTGGQTASLNSTNYTANWWTQGQSPATNSGASGSGQPWTSNGAHHPTPQRHRQVVRSLCRRQPCRR